MCTQSRVVGLKLMIISDCEMDKSHQDVRSEDEEAVHFLVDCPVLHELRVDHSPNIV